MSARPSLALHAEIETADGLAQYRWGGEDREAGNRPQAISFGSTLMNGYANGSCSLARNVNRQFNDMGLYDTIRFVGVDGQVAYEGRGARFPREASTEHRISAEFVGWMAHARDRSIPFLGVDQDMASWGQMTAARQAALSAYAPKGPGTVMWDKTLSQSFDGTWVAGELPICEAWFDAGPGQSVGAIHYAWTRGANVASADATWHWTVAVSSDIVAPGGVEAGNLRAAGPGSGIHDAFGNGYRYAYAQFYNTTAGGAAGTFFNLDWTRLQVIGRHGIALQGTGLLGSDLIKHTAGIACPLLDTSEVLATSHPIDQFVFRELTDPYDMWLVANQYERWNLAVWEDRKLHYHPLPDVTQLQTADWVLRSDHKNGLKRGYDGPTTDGSANGVIVRFQNIDNGQAELIDPTTNTALADTDTRLAANRAGIQSWKKIQLPNPNTPAGAAKIGAAALAEFNRQRTPGRFSIAGHIQDAAGNWHQGWVPRAGQTVILEEDDDDPIRVIHEASWAGRELTINADASSKTLDAIIADMG